MDRSLRMIADYLIRLAELPIEIAYFRGHADEGWELVPSAFRAGKYGITNENELAGWRSRSSRFAIPRPQSALEWLVLAQHYGVPTPLLDWTTNPLTALFFATQPSGKLDKAGVVLRFPNTAFHPLRKPETVDPFLSGRKKPALLDTSAMNPRTLAQDSAMSVHCKGCDKLSISKDNIVFRVDRKDKPNVQQALKQFGLSAERIYSDIGTAAREYASHLDATSLL